jgi:carbamate kinase
VTTVVALGGNALLRAGDKGTAAEQLSRLREAVAALEPLLDGPLVITHGNGPQVGNELLRQERAAGDVPPLPLYLAVAQTQAEIGALIARALRERTSTPVACVLTHVVVDGDDPAFAEPAKPIGPFYDRERAQMLREERGWTLVEEDGRGWRRTVASPAPLEIVELAAIRALLAAGTIVVACGGGGIPVVRGPEGALAGVDAVIDKDRASALLAPALGASRLVILTDVDAVLHGFGTPEARPIGELEAGEAEALAAQLPAGSMRPKLEAAAAFVRATGGDAVVTSAHVLGRALAGAAGTWIRQHGPLAAM